MSLPRHLQLKDANGRPVEVESRVDIGEQLEPEEFWNLINIPAYLQPTTGEKRTELVWSHRLMRRAYFGIDTNLPDKVHAKHKTMPQRDGSLGANRTSQDPDFLIATDLPYNPIMRTHPASTGVYSGKYYPRRMQDWINDEFHPAYVITGDKQFLIRMKELLQFLFYSQYDAHGNNTFTSSHFPDEFAALNSQGLTKQWYGGWDYLFDWEWPDAYGYTWHLHEPDHHVNSEIAVAMIRAYELTQEGRYLEAAVQFVYNQVPRYGWHTGVWNGRRYYWSEYNPSGPGNPTLDATDNIQSLVAQAVAMVGFYTQDFRLLEYARGLLWYMVREFTWDGRWYYDGAENPLNQRKAVSHDTACLYPALRALPYLIKAGVAVGPELDGLDVAYSSYMKDSVGKAYKTYSDGTTTKNKRHVSTYFLVENASLHEVRFSDQLPYSVESGGGLETLEIRASRLIPPSSRLNSWTIDPEQNVAYKVSPAELGKGLVFPLQLKSGDVVLIKYELPPSESDQEPPELPSSQISFQAGETVTTVEANVPGRWGLAVTEDQFLTLAARVYFPFAEEVNATVAINEEKPAELYPGKLDGGF